MLVVGLGSGCASDTPKSAAAEGTPTSSASDSASPPSVPIDADGDGHLPPSDCNDTDGTIHPEAMEVCNEKDDNCDGEIDEGVLLTFYADADADRYGDPGAPVEACAAPDGTVADQTDCNDDDPEIHPDALDLCNRVDDDCDGEVDEDGEEPLYADTDGDGFGDDGVRSTGCPSDGWTLDSGDCDDTDPSANPADEDGDGLLTCDGDCD
ncbi:MAG TPA: hypothetical protein DFR83_02975, partial [Deltaproteobacteria bacterium]|nr:hypothetical protein [Deltaproteobacteria bacterium]